MRSRSRCVPLTGKNRVIMPSVARRRGQACFHGVLLLMLVPCCQAQPFPPAGSGDVTIFAQDIQHHGVIKADGSRAPGGHSYNRSLAVEVDYSVTNRLSLSAGIPYVFG